MEELRVGGLYRHFKGNLYKVLYIAKHSEDESLMVVYQKEYDDKSIWVRPFDMFIDYKTIDGQSVKRFTLVE